jgi:hypothetical protein
VPHVRQGVRGPKKTGRSPSTALVKAYPESVVTLLLRSLARRIPPTTIVVLIIALLLTQAASFVCGAQCLQHQKSSSTAAAMTNCHAMHPSSNGPAAQTCPPAATSFCVTDLLANNQQKTLTPPTIQADAPPTALLPILIVAARTRVFPQLRSTIGDPPLLTPLRV